MSGATASAVLLGAGLGMQTAGSIKQSQATKAAARYQSAVSTNNATLAEWQAQSALEVGARNEQTQRLRTAQLKGSQRARLAANGVALDQGSALNILDDTDYMGELDATSVRDNSKRQAWALRNQVAGYTSDAELYDNRADAEDPFANGATTLITGAGSVSDAWYRRARSTKG